MDSAVENTTHTKLCKADSLIRQMPDEERIELYTKKGEDAWVLAWDILHRKEWKLVRGKNNEEGCVYSGTFKDTGKIFKLDGIVETSTDTLFKQCVVLVEDSPQWTHTTRISKVVETIREDMDIHYTVTSDMAGGLITTRDFVNVRHWKREGDTILSVGCAVHHPHAPETNKYIRGESKPGGWVFQDIPGHQDKCRFIWIMNTDMKGWLPQRAIDHSIPGMLMAYITDLKNKIATLSDGTQ